MAGRAKKITAPNRAGAPRPPGHVNDTARIKMSSPEKTKAEVATGSSSGKMAMKAASKRTITDLVFSSPNAGMGKFSKKMASGIGVGKR